MRLVPGKSNEQKADLAQEITRDVMKVLSYGEEAVSVAKRSHQRTGPTRCIGPIFRTSGTPFTRSLDTTHSKNEELVMNISFENKVALVTGAASGLGLATAKAFGESGASVVLADWNEKEAQAAAMILVSQRALIMEMSDLIGIADFKPVGKPRYFPSLHGLLRTFVRLGGSRR